MLRTSPQRRVQARYRPAVHAAPQRKSWLRPASICAALALSVLLSGDIAASESLQQWRALFQATEQNLQAGRAADYQALRHYPLYPYLLYQDLTLRLKDFPQDEVRQFLRTYPATPLANRLRSAWLRQLALAGRWADYVQDAQPSSDAQLECWRRQALLQTGQATAALHDFASLWLRGSALPNACDALITLWQQQGQPSAQLLWQRFALALASNDMKLARYLRTTMSEDNGAWADTWLALTEQPQLLLHNERLQQDDARRPALIADALRRWMRMDALAANAALDTLHQRDARLIAPLAETQRQLALWLASDYHPSALARLQALPAAVVDQDVREWRIRLQLRTADWSGVLRELETLPADQQENMRWQYWRGRALESLGRTAEARVIYQRLAAQRDYHGFLAADRLGSAYTITDTPLQVTPQTLDALLNQTPGLQRARELYILGREAAAEAEWRSATQALDKAVLRQAALLAQHWGWRYQALTTAARAGYWDDLRLRFPLDYRDLVLGSSNADAAWVYAVLRQESNFRADARSPVGALGLMQIMPATGQQLATELQDSAAPNLLLPATNIRYGAYYLQQIAQRLQNNPMLATAAYNAGPAKVGQWLPTTASTAADIWVETIPYRETRSYVQRVMEYAAVYSYLLDLPEAQRSLSTRMKPVLPNAAGAKT